MAALRKDSKGRALYQGEYERNDGKYKFAYTENGKRRCLYASTLEDLREKERVINKLQYEGIDTYLNGTATLNYLFDRYIQMKKNLRNKTRENMKFVYNRYVRNSFGNKVCSEIKYSELVLIYEHYLNEKGLALNTLKSINRVLYPVFEMAIRDNIIENNPCTGALAAASKKPGKNHGVRKALTLEEQRHFMNYIKNTPKFRHWLPLFTVLLGTGCRVGEVIGLRWCDINLEEREIDINHSIVYYAEVGAKTSKSVVHVSLPKTEAGIRKLPMIPCVYAAFMEEQANQAENGSNTVEIDGMTGFIFANRFGNVHNPQTINLAIKRILEEHNAKEVLDAKRENRDPVIIPSFSCHCLRHTFCSRLVENGEDVKTVQALMGHANYETTLDVYAEISDMKKKEVMNNLGTMTDFF